MNESAKYFLPSLVRGVYRLDERLSKIETDEESRIFIETKLRFLPEQFIKTLEENINLNSINFENSIRNKCFISGLERNSGNRTENKNKYQTYFTINPYFNNQIEKNEEDQNFLESEFVRKILAPIISKTGLQQIIPQNEISGYFPDFTLEASRKYIFEVDGFGKFQTRNALDKFLHRQNVFVREGWTVLRYSYSDIMENTERTRKQLFDILKSDQKFRLYLHGKLGLNNPLMDLFGTRKNSTTPNPKYDVIDLVNEFFLIQDFCTTILTTHSPDSVQTISFEDRLPYPFPIVAFALSDLYHFLKSVEQLLAFQLKITPLEVTYENFNNRYVRLLHPLIKIEPKKEHDSDIISISREELLTVSSQITSPSTGEPTFIFSSNLSVETIREYLSYITQSIFRYAKGTKPSQEKILKKIFDHQDVLGICSTGSGKSFCFWLPALLKPGLSIVICPLRSLMRDQKLTLERYGIASIDFINSDVKKDERIRIINDAKLGKLKLLYVAPERIRIKDFMEELKSIQDFVNINYLIIDEAHCISEWGHDFRPSYLTIPSFNDQLKEQNPTVQLIALTATAGQMVEKDILNLLRMNKGYNLERERDLDRKHFSYQIESVDGYEEKSDMFDEILTNSIPKALAHSLKLYPNNLEINAVVNSLNEGKEKGIGIIYVVYADPHGKHSTADGLAHYLRKTMKIIEPEMFQERRRQRISMSVFGQSYSLEDYSTGKVRAFSSKIPTMCPFCFSSHYITQTIKDESDFDYDDITQEAEQQPGRKVCLDCGHEFNAEDTISFSPNKYLEITQKNQSDFKRGKLDILVATKGFGMGIDKASVRFVLHATPSSSIESWYQEIGRAGRDEERAHCAALVDVPNNTCLDELRRERKRREKPTQYEPRCNWQSGCPHGKDGLCDYGKQHVFIKHSYMGVVTDVISAVRTLDRLITSFVEGDGQSIQFKTTQTYLKYHELALFRLKLLGMVEDFSVTYGGLTVHFDVSLRTQDTKEGKLTICTDAEEIKDRLNIYLEKNKLYDESIGTIDDRIRECKQNYDTDILSRLDKQNLKQYQKYQGFYHRIIDYLLVLLDHTYENIVRMRYDMLWNLYEHVILNEKHCRRKSILDFIAEHGFLNESYRCGLCDNCVADLNFVNESRIAPPKTNKMDELELELEKAFDSSRFDYDYLVILKDVFREYPTSTYRKARAILEGSPNNLVALYFTREFSPKNEEEANTVRLLETANRALNIDTVKRLYESSHHQYRSNLLLLLNNEYGQFNNDKGIRWLYSKATEEYSKSRNETLFAIGEIFATVIIYDWIEVNFLNRFEKINKELSEVYYG